MSRLTARRGIVALGIGMALAMSAGITASTAQIGPRVLPSSPEYQDRAPDLDRQLDRNFGPANRGDRFARPEERLERRLVFLHSQLRITPAQERGWQALVAVLREEARDRTQDRGDRRYFRAPSVVDRLQERQQMLADRGAGLERVIRVLRPLYASFSAEQRRTADQLMFQADGGRGFGARGLRGPGFGRDGGPDRFDGDDRQNRDDRPYDNRDRQDRDYRPGDYR